MSVQQDDFDDTVSTTQEDLPDPSEDLPDPNEDRPSPTVKKPRSKRNYNLVKAFLSLEEAEDFIKSEYPTNVKKRRSETNACYRTYYDCKVAKCPHKCVLEIPGHNFNFNVLESETSHIEHSSDARRTGIKAMVRKKIHDLQKEGKWSPCCCLCRLSLNGVHAQCRFDVRSPNS